MNPAAGRAHAVTTKSQTAGCLPLRRDQKLRSLWVFWVWHAICLPLGPMACFDFEPIVYLDENQVPEFERTAFDDGAVLVVDDANVTFFAIAFDPDHEQGDSLDFLWFAGPEFVSSSPMPVPGDTADERVNFGSKIVVPYNLELDGLELSCTVVDPEGGETERTWPMEVL